MLISFKWVIVRVCNIPQIKVSFQQQIMIWLQQDTCLYCKNRGRVNILDLHFLEIEAIVCGWKMRFNFSLPPSSVKELCSIWFPKNENQYCEDKEQSKYIIPNFYTRVCKIKCFVVVIIHPYVCMCAQNYMLACVQVTMVMDRDQRYRRHRSKSM